MPTKKVFINIAVYSPKRRRLALVKSHIEENKYGFLRVQLKRGYTVQSWAKKCLIEQYLVSPDNMIQLDMFIKQPFKVEYFFLVITDDYIPHQAFIGSDQSKFRFLPVYDRLVNKTVEHTADTIVDNIRLYNLVPLVEQKGWSGEDIEKAVNGIIELETLNADPIMLKKLWKNIPDNAGDLATCNFGYWFKCFSQFKQASNTGYNPLYAVKNATKSKTIPGAEDMYIST